MNCERISGMHFKVCIVSHTTNESKCNISKTEVCWKTEDVNI